MCRRRRLSRRGVNTFSDPVPFRLAVRVFPSARTPGVLSHSRVSEPRCQVIKRRGRRSPECAPISILQCNSDKFCPLLPSLSPGALFGSIPASRLSLSLPPPFATRGHTAAKLPYNLSPLPIATRGYTAQNLLYRQTDIPSLFLEKNKKQTVIITPLTQVTNQLTREIRRESTWYAWP